jgi:tetratricopeptide (TPR) repeat protein
MRIIQTLVPSQVKNGILDILKDAQPYFPRLIESTRIPIFFDDQTFPTYVNLTGWKFNTPMLTGLSRWYQKHAAMAGDKIIIEVLNDKLHLRLQSSRNFVRPEYLSKSNAWLDEGFAQSKLGRFEEAILSFNKAIEINPNNVPAWSNKGWTLDKLERFEEAIKCYDKAIEISPNGSSFTWFNKGQALKNLSRFEDALQSFAKAIEIDPKYEDAWFQKARALYELGRFEEARLSYDKAIELNPNNEEIWFHKGLAFGKLARFEEALLSLDNAIALNPSKQKAWLLKGDVLNSLGHFEEAIKCIDKAFEINLNIDEQAWVIKGAALGGLGRFEEALLNVDKTIKINPNNDAAWMVKGMALGGLGRFEEARLSYDKAIELNTNYYGAWVNKGWTLGKLGRTKEADKCYKRALELKPNNDNLSSKQYLVLPGRNSVEVWSEKRLPFEPKGWLQSLRDDIRSALKTIDFGPNEVLYALYVSPVKEACDVDNILFYNVGVEYFPQTGYAGLRFERSFSQPPPPLRPTNGPSLQHYHRYWCVPKERSFECCWIPTRKLARWNAKISADAMVKLKKSKNPAYVWYSIKSGLIELLSESQAIPNQFGLRMSIRVPNSITSSFIDLLKPLLDGTVAAFHRHDGTNQALVAERLTSVLEVRAQDILSYLSENPNAVLGTRTLLWIRQEGVQWNPADDRCLAVELLFESSKDDFAELSGELFEVEERKEYANNIEPFCKD